MVWVAVPAWFTIELFQESGLLMSQRRKQMLSLSPVKWTRILVPIAAGLLLIAAACGDDDDGDDGGDGGGGDGGGGGPF